MHADGASGDETLKYFTIWNAQGLQPRTVPTKVPYVQDLLHEHNQLYMAITETWLRDQKDPELRIQGYTLFRQDRNRDRRRRGRNSGGVAVYLRNDYAVDTEMVMNYSNRVTETLGLFSKSRNLLLIVMYRQPDDVGGHRSTHMEFRQPLNRIHDLLSTLSEPVPDILLCGKFNLPHAVWPEGAIRTRASQEKRIMIGDLVDIAQEFFLFQLITQSTHRRGNMLDLLFQTIHSSCIAIHV